MAIFYHPDITKTAYAFDTTRKGADIADYLTGRGWSITIPQPICVATAKAYHAATYIDALQAGEPRYLAESQGFEWDEMMWRSVTAQSGAMVDAAHYACRHGRAYALSAGFHHARSASGAGFCTLNGLAIATGEILAHYPDRTVIILDADAHCGGGTMNICADWDRLIHLDIHTSGYDAYAPQAPHRRQSVETAEKYLPTLRALLASVEARIKPGDLLVYNAGMDIHEDCRIGGREGITTDIIRQREHYVSEWALAHSLSVAACLAGGYAGGYLTHDTLVELHAMSVEILMHRT